MYHRFLKRFLSTLRCVNCGRRYEPENIRFLSRQKELWFLSLYCPVCHNQGMVAAVVGQGEPPEAVSDLTEKELEKFGDRSQIGIDDVLDMHIFLKEFQGDFTSLFSESNRKQ